MSVANPNIDVPPRRPSLPHRTQSSPSLPPRSTSFRPPTPVPLAALEFLSFPVLVFEPSLRLYSINAAGRNAFGLADDADSRIFGHTGAEQFLWTSSLEGSSPADKIRRELSRLARRSASTSWSVEAASPAILELKGGKFSGSRWWAEVCVDSFIPAPSEDAPPSNNDEWYTVTLVKPVKTGGLAVPASDSSSDHTPTLSTAGRLAFSPLDQGEGSEGSWAHSVPPPSTSDGLVSASAPATWPSARPAIPLRLSGLPSPSTPPLSSAGTGSSKISSRSSLLSYTSASSVSTAASGKSVLMPADIPPADVLAAAKLVGMGISVTSAGLQLSSTSPATLTSAPPIHSPSSQPKLSSLSNPPSTFERAPRPTSLPPLAPPPPKSTPDSTQLLLFAALANLPNTGIIVADPELASGFVNPLARELLMGIMTSDTKPGSTSGESSRPSVDLNYWKAGAWSPDDGWGEHSSASTSTSTTSSFFPGFSSHGGPDPFEAKDLTHSAIVAAGEAKVVEKNKGSGGSSLRLGNPTETNRYRTTVAGILARSLTNAEKYQSGVSSSRGAEANFSSIGKNVGRKTYRIFDASFNQRIIDPLEPLLEISVRRGETPLTVEDDEGGVTSGMVVGVEVDVWDVADPTKTSGRRKRVRRRLVEISASPIYEPTTTGVRGRHLGGVLLLRDVTDDSKRQIVGSNSSPSLLKRSAKADMFFKHIVDHIPHLVWTTTPLGSHDFFNNGWYEYTGLEPEESLGLGWQSPFHPDDMPQTIKAWSHSLETGEPYTVEYRCQRHDGEWRWMLGKAEPLRNADGVIEGWFGTCTDVDEFVKIRAELRNTQEHFRATLQAADLMLTAIDPDYNIRFMEGSHKSIYSNLVAGGNDLVGLNMKTLWPTSIAYAAIDEVLAGVTPYKVLEKVPSSEAGHYYRCSITAIEDVDSDGVKTITGATIVALDITETIETKERLDRSYLEGDQLRASEEAAQEASRLKSRFVSILSHELRTPVAGMIGLAELLLEEPDLKSDHRIQVGKIMRSGEILLELVGMVLDLGKVEAGKLELEKRPFGLEMVVSDARLFSLIAKNKGLEFADDIPPFPSGRVLGDMPRLRQVLSNLLSNAIKFTKEGSVTFRLIVDSETPTTVSLRFEVQDTGIGVKPEALTQLFTPFHQADSSTARKYGGTGLGLSIAKSLIELMGGSIALESEYGRGSKVTVKVTFEKMATDAPSEPPSPTITSAQLVREDKWILIADDNPLIRDILSRTLTQMRFNVQSVSNGVEAIAAIKSRHFDIILMDCNMPTMDGLEATTLIRQSENPQIAKVKILALTASAMKGDEERCLAAGMDGYLNKPIRRNMLESALIQQLAPPPSPTPDQTDSPPPGSDDSQQDALARDAALFGVVRRLSHPSYEAGSPTLPQETF